MDNTIIRMTPEQLEAEKSKATEELNKSLEAKEKELSELKATQKELAGKQAKEELEQKQAQEKALAQKELDAKQKQGVFTNPETKVTVKHTEVKNLVGHTAILTAMGRVEGKTALQMANEIQKTGNDRAKQDVYEIVKYMGNTLKSEAGGKYQSFIDSAKSIGLGSVLEGAGLGEAGTDAELVQVLRPANSVQAMQGFKTVQLNNGVAKVNVVESGSNATHIASASSGSESNPTYGQRILTAKKIGSYSVIDNDRLRFGDTGLASEIEQDIIAGIQQEWDRAFLLGSGSAHEPLGLINAASNSFTRTSSPDATKIGKDLRKAKKYLQDDNIKFLNPYWIGRPATQTSIEDQYSTNQDQMGYASRLENDGRLMGYQYIATNNMPTGTDHCVLLVDASEIILGLGYGILLDADASTKFNTDQTTIRGLFSYDIAYKRTDGICKIGSTSDWETA